MEFKSLRGRVETCPFLFQPNLRENYRGRCTKSGAIKSAAPSGALLSLRVIFRSQRPRAGIFRSPYADLKIGARKDEI